MTAATIVFDLDGTLVDTAPDLIDTLNVVFAREGLPPVPYETARKLIGGGARAMIARGLEAEGRTRSCQPSSIGCLTISSRHYSEHIADRSRPFPGLIDALDALGGRRLALRGLHQQTRTAFGALARSNSASPIASPRSAARIRSASRNRIRKCCAARSPRPAAICNNAIMIGDS